MEMDYSIFEGMFVPVVFVACLCAGYVLKNFMPTDNKWIPLFELIFGAILNCLISDPSVKAAVYGGFTGLASTGFHQVFKQFIEHPKAGSEIGSKIDEDHEIDDPADDPDTEVGMSYKLGIDVSAYQGNINWKSVSKDDVDFAIIRVAGRYGKSGKIYRDSKARDNLTEARKYGIKTGVYFFTQAVTEREARNEADLACKYAKNYKTTLPVTIDTESLAGSRHNKLSKAKRTAVVKAFCEQVKKHGFTPMVYSNLSWLNNNLDMKKLPYKVWVAHYAKKCGYKDDYYIWQYKSSGKVKGISGNVDMDKLYEKTEKSTTRESSKSSSTKKTTTKKTTTKKSVSGSDIVKEAKKYKGDRSHRFCKWYGVSDDTPWCAIFVSYILKKVGIKWKKCAYVPDAQKQAYKNGKWVKMADAKIGDIVVFTWHGGGNNTGTGSRDHIGFIIARKYDKKGNMYFQTIEGNTSGSKVAIRKRWPVNIYGIYRYR